MTYHPEGDITFGQHDRLEKEKDVVDLSKELEGNSLVREAERSGDTDDDLLSSTDSEIEDAVDERFGTFVQKEQEEAHDDQEDKAA